MDIDGVIAAVPTAFTCNGALDANKFAAHCQWSLENGADGLNILGTTGEANSQYPTLRKEVMKEAVNAVGPERLMVGTATPDFETTLELTRYADELGYPVALLLPPYYYKPLADSQLFGWFQQLDAALGDASIQIYLYNFPALTGIPYPVPVIEALVKELPDRIKGIKDSSGDLPYCREIVAKIPEFKVFPSSETCLGSARTDGFAGCISASVNVTAPLCEKVWHGSRTPDDTLLEDISFIRQSMASVPLIPAVKYLISLREGTPDWEFLRLPLEPLTIEQKHALEAAVHKLGYRT
ncbi:MAG: dihydrodipicolinate synthase family protein [Proteobacteria bacterium]|nr:dihydrodipicolinate synthase family protein [Pseudomonadota bacterium]